MPLGDLVCSLLSCVSGHQCCFFHVFSPSVVLVSDLDCRFMLCLTCWLPTGMGEITMSAMHKRSLGKQPWWNRNAKGQTCKPVGLLIMMCSCGLWSWDFDSGSDFWMSEWSTASWMNLQKPKLGLEDGNWDNLLGSMLNAGGCAWGSLRAFLCQFYTLSGAHGKLQDTFLHSDSHHRRSPCPIWALHAFCIPGAMWHASWWTPEAPTSRALNDRSGNCCKQREGWTGRYYCCGLGTAQLLLGETTFLLGDVCGRRAVEL